METISTSPPPPTTATTTVKTPDPESEAPQSTTPKHLPPPPSSNGVLKRHKPLNHHHPHHHQPPLIITYKECLKNHAATIGGHAIDGCGEFMPSPTSSPSYPTSLKCAACGCHRNFHRREPEETLYSPPPIQHLIEYQPHHRHHPPPPPSQPPQTTPNSPGNSPSPPPISSSYYPSSAPHMLLALSTGLSSETHNPANPTTTNSGGSGKKRFRTKFTQQQKEKMQEIAEKIGWKMQKRDEELIMGFCNEIGVDKNVFKVWMHNNKINNNNKKDVMPNNIININNNNNNNNNGSSDGIDFIISRNNNGVDHQLHLHNGGDSFSAAPGNVISSSSC